MFKESDTNGSNDLDINEFKVFWLKWCKLVNDKSGVEFNWDFDSPEL